MADVQILKQKGCNFLWIDDYLCMWDLPIERQSQRDLADQASGDVLVAGYGLGIVQRYLLKNTSVLSIITIELHQEVIDECKRVYGKIDGIVEIGDFYVLSDDKKYDCIIGDIWDDILPSQLHKYKYFKQRAISLLKPGGKILAWGQDYFEYLLERKIC